MMCFLCKTLAKRSKLELKEGKRLLIGGGFCNKSDVVEVVCGNMVSLPELSFKRTTKRQIPELFCTLNTLQKLVEESSSSPQTQTSQCFPRISFQLCCAMSCGSRPVQRTKSVTY